MAIALSVLFAGVAFYYGSPWLRVAIEVVPLLAIVLARWRTEVLLTLILAQRFLSDGALIPTHRAEVAYPPVALFAPLRAVREPFRIAATGVTLIPDIATMYGLEDARGATAMTFAPLAETFPLWPTSDLMRPMLAMMNVRYAVLPTWEPIPAGWTELAIDRMTRIVENPRALPRAFVPRSVRGAEHALDEMKSAADFAERAWIEGAGEGANGPGRVTTARDGSALRMQASMDAAGYVVISETAWPGWRAYVDGRRVRTPRANHAFLSVFVPAGRHEIRLRYLPQSFVLGRTISVAVAALLLLALAIRQVV